MNIWLIMIFIGLLTFAIRLSFIALLERFEMPRNFRRALRFVPIAVLSAILLPELTFSNNNLLISPTNPRLLAGIIASFVAYKTKSVIWTIITGMTVFWILRMFIQ